ncbi:MAG: DUF3047 domain-containing protein [Balneolaceae bacterium]|nr:MAG: DUF3047 domain-containing protein [Balneolaceae bacterium]
MKITLLALALLMIVNPDEPGLATMNVGDFSGSDSDTMIPAGWETMRFRGLKPTEYSLTELDGRRVVKAVSEASSSGLLRREMIDLNEFPILEWSWKVGNLIEKGDVTQKDGDDYPARIYLMFDYSLRNLSWSQRNLIRLTRIVYGRVPSRAINYIYANQESVGLITENPYTDLVTMVVVDAGSENTGQWRTYRRNVLDDYRLIYGENPPPVEAIAIMTDSDDTGGSAVTWFGDIRFIGN